MIWGCLLVFSIVAGLTRNWPTLRSRRERSSVEFFEDFYSGTKFSRAFIADVYEFIEENFGTASRLVPSDRFLDVEGVSKGAFDSDTDFLMNSTFRRLLRISSDPKLEKEIEVSLDAVETVDDLITVIANYELGTRP